MNNDGALKETLHWSNSDLEVHKVVVGPYENNVFVLRCKATGEGVLIDAVQDSEKYDAIVFNAGGYTHTSVAIADALAAVKPRVIEVHLSNVMAREKERHTSLLAQHCLGTISGFGFDSYVLAVEQLTR